MTGITLKAKKHLVQKLLQTNPRFVEQALVVLYKAQTQDERSKSQTCYRNQVGFNKPDAQPLSQYARKLRFGARLNPKEIRDAQYRLVKYVGQLVTASDLQELFSRATLVGSIVGETTNAVQVQPATGAHPIWLPKSVVYSEYSRKKDRPLLIDPWFLKREVTALITAKVVKETARAVCLQVEGTLGERWVPKSAIYSTLEASGTQQILVAKWALAS
jgi:hypothetical protein